MDGMIPKWPGAMSAWGYSRLTRYRIAISIHQQFVVDKRVETLKSVCEVAGAAGRKPLG